LPNRRRSRQGSTTCCNCSLREASSLGAVPPLSTELAVSAHRDSKGNFYIDGGPQEPFRSGCPSAVRGVGLAAAALITASTEAARRAFFRRLCMLQDCLHPNGCPGGSFRCAEGQGSVGCCKYQRREQIRSEGLATATVVDARSGGDGIRGKKRQRRSCCPPSPVFWIQLCRKRQFELRGKLGPATVFAVHRRKQLQYLAA